MEEIFQYFCDSDKNAKAYLYWFVKNFKPADFNDIDRLFYCFLAYCVFLKITPSYEFLVKYLDVDAKVDIRKHSIRTDSIQTLDYRDTAQFEEAVSIIKRVALELWSNYSEGSLEDFRSDMYTFITKYKAAALSDLFMKTYPTLNDGSDINDVTKNLRTQLVNIDSDFDVAKLKELNDSILDDESADEMKFIANTNIPAVDGDIGGIFTKLIYTLNAQPAGGKTRLSLANFVYPTLVEAGKDVIYYETELSKGQVMNILIAFHIIKLYGGKVKIPDALMNKRSEMTAEQLRIYEAAKLDLFTNPKYGKFIFNDNTNVAEMEEEIEYTLETLDNPGMLCIDYMGLLKYESHDRYDRKEGYEVITEAYEMCRRIVKAHDICAVCINQFNDKGIDAAYAGKSIRSGYVQGGHIVQRHTDYDISLTFTEEQKIAQCRMLSVSKTRGTAGFDNVLLRADLSVSLFVQKIIDAMEQ